MLSSAGSHGSATSASSHRPGGRALVASPYPRLFGSALLLAAKARVRLWDLSLHDVEASQMRQLRGILSAASRTELGRSLGFSSIETYRDFVSRVPLGDYDSFWPYIERMRSGEKNLIVAERIKYFGNSSGSVDQGQAQVSAGVRAPDQLSARQRQRRLMRYLDHTGDDSFTPRLRARAVPAHHDEASRGPSSSRATPRS
jgi:hypothetical protein